MSVLICPGFHSSQLTKSFVRGLRSTDDRDFSSNLLIFPASDYSPLSASDIVKFLEKHQGNPQQAEPVIFISFSAGVVGAIMAAIAWENKSGKVKAFFALDGWGVPLWGNFPIHRLSHDYFTHQSSALLGAGEDSFYADPPVEHLQLWRSPQDTQGWWVKAPGCKISCSAAEFLTFMGGSFLDSNAAK
ncbi:MAG: hypothetical protein QNJ54_11180 [Prochloraceae cyanobacterium]|nr:hypothetical protein [Prochloraceae cyanobacterium]